PGPLAPDGDLPNASDCSEFDRIYAVTRLDLERLDDTGEATADIQDWPWQHGAPVKDGDGIPNNYDIEAGDRPDITGHQMLWWVMNDLGGPHGWGQTEPLGVEVQASAFSFAADEPALHHATFFRYRIINRQSYTIDSVYVGLWRDVDLGDGTDDFVGSDTTLGMGFVYNGDDFDDSIDGYGAHPPALGLDFLQGPVAENDGLDNDGDGSMDEPGERLRMSTFMIYHGDSGVRGNPYDAVDAYNYMRAIWRDGTPLTYGGTGYGGTTPTHFMWPGDPVSQAYWSEENTDGLGSRNTP